MIQFIITNHLIKGGFMSKKVQFILVGIIIVALSITGCKEKEEPPPAPAHTPTMQQPTVVMPRGQTTVIVPEEVKGKWDAVVLEIVDKSTNSSQQITIKLGDEYQIPNSNIKIKVGEFLPDFRMDGLTITSASNEPKNPAVHVTIYEGEKQIFSKWLYSKFPTIHPFQHEKYRITLIKGIKAGSKKS